ncbi:MAG: hypothetical protein ACTSRZ_14700 [Promethearchaeota archaeon]
MIFKKTDLIEERLKYEGSSLIILNTFKRLNGKNTKFIFIMGDVEGFLSFYCAPNLKLMKKIKIECGSEIWCIKSYWIDKKTQIIFVGSILGYIYAYKIEFELIINSNNEIEDVKEILVDMIWKQNARDMITNIELEDINQDGKYELIITSMDNTLRVLDPLNGDLLWGQVFQSGISSIGIVEEKNKENSTIIKKYLVAGALDGSIRIFDAINGGLYKFTQLPNNIRDIAVYKSILICACDDFNLYFLEISNNLNNLNKNESVATKVSKQKNNFQIKTICRVKCTAYPWFLKIYNEKLLFTTYSFNFMEGMVEKQENQIPSIQIIDLDKFLIIKEEKNIEQKPNIAAVAFLKNTLIKKDNINVQNLTPLIEANVFRHIFLKKHNKDRYFTVATTGKSIFCFDLEKNKIIKILDTKGIPNAVQFLKIDADHGYLTYLDDEKILKIVEIQNKI